MLTNYFYRDETFGGRWRLNDEAPEWFHHAVIDAHDDELPDDWRFATIYRICEWFDNGNDRMDMPQLADQLCDVYTSDLAAWYATNYTRYAYINTAYRDGMYSVVPEHFSMFDLMAVGQYVAILQMAEIIYSYHSQQEDSE